MAQNDMNIANQGFPAFRADLNDQLEALVTNSSGATAPATTFPHQWWLDTSTTPSTLRQRNAANDAWIVVGLLNQSTNTFNLPVAQGGTGAADAGGARTNLGALASTDPSYTGTLTGGTGVINIGSGQLYKDASGNVGIGTSTTTDAGVTITQNVTRDGGFQAKLSLQSTGSNNFPGLYFSGSSTTSWPAIIATTSTSGNNANNVTSSIRFLMTSATTGDIAFSTNNFVGTATQAERMRIDSSGNLLVGATSSFSGSGISPRVTITNSAGLGVNGIGSADAGFATRPSANHNYYAGFFLNNDGTGVGNIFVTASSTAYNTSSDYRLKHDIQPMTGALAKVQQLKPVTYKWNADDSQSQGFIAHELQEVVPECVTGEKDAVDAEGKPVYQGIDTSFLVATLTAALQEAVAKIAALEARLDAANL